MSPSVSPPTVAFGQFGYVTHHNPSGGASPTMSSTTSGSSCCDPLSIRLCGSGQHGLITSTGSVHPNPNSVTPLSMDALPNNRFAPTTGGIANASHHHNSPTTPTAFYASPPSAYPDGYCNPSVLDPATVSFYQTLPSYGFKDATTAAAAASWAGIAAQSAAASYYYDPTFTQYGYSSAYGDFNGAARRKNVTRDSTTTLKAWLNEHRKNPYPTKGEKIMLAIITKMTLTQVSTWFANARRRLKKENKMTWEPRNRCDDNDDEILTSDDENENKPANTRDEDQQSSNRNQISPSKDTRKDSLESSRVQLNPTPTNCTGILMPSVNSSTATFISSSAAQQQNFTIKCDSANPVKPKIWSLAATAIDDKPKSPPPPPPPPPLHLAAVRNIHSGAFSTSTSTNLSGWYHQNAPYPSVSPYGAHYMPSLSGHFQHTPASTSLPPQADTPPQTPPALKLASMHLNNSIENGMVTSDHSMNSVNPKLIGYRNQSEQIGQSGNTSPPTQIYGSDFRINCDNSSSGGNTSISRLSSAAHQQTQSNK